MSSVHIFNFLVDLSFKIVLDIYTYLSTFGSVATALDLECWIIAKKTQSECASYIDITEMLRIMLKLEHFFGETLECRQ